MNYCRLNRYNFLAALCSLAFATQLSAQGIAFTSQGRLTQNGSSLSGPVTGMIGVGSIHSNQLAVGSVHSNALVIGSIHSNQLAVGIIHSNALAFDSVTASALASGNIHSNLLAAGSIHSNGLVIGSIHSNLLAVGNIHSNLLTAGTIHSNALALGSVIANALTVGSIHSNLVAVGSVHSNALVISAPLLTMTLNRQLSTTTVSWPSPSTAFILQENASLNTTNWLASSQPVSDDGTNRFVVLSSTAGNRFYRLFRPSP